MSGVPAPEETESGVPAPEEMENNVRAPGQPRGPAHTGA
jgi:hypothetical protein